MNVRSLTGNIRTVREVTEDGRERIRTSFVASTQAVARDGIIIDQDSWVLENYLRNPIVLDAHNVWDNDAILGRAENVQVDRSADPHLSMDIVWDTADDNPKAKRIARQYADGMLHAVSVRWVPGRVVRQRNLDVNHPLYAEDSDVEVHFDAELYEVSAVTLPGDPGAVAVRDARRAEMRAHMLDLIRSDADVRAALEAMDLTRSATLQPGRVDDADDLDDDWLRDMPVRRVTDLDTLLDT